MKTSNSKKYHLVLHKLKHVLENKKLNALSEKSQNQRNRKSFNLLIGGKHACRYKGD